MTQEPYLLPLETVNREQDIADENKFDYDIHNRKQIDSFKKK